MEPGGKYFASIEGVVYEVDMEGNPTILLYCPPAKTGSLTIPKTVRLVENAAFVNTKLTEIIFEEYDPESEAEFYGKPLLEIGTGSANTYMISSSTYAVFKPKSKLKISFPSHLKRLGTNVCYTLATGSSVIFNMDAELEAVEGAAFYACSGLKELHLPKVHKIGIAAVNNNTNLTAITFAPGSDFTELPLRSFYSNSKLPSLELPASVTKIGSEVFSGCKALASMRFADGSQLQEIGDAAFAQTAFVEFIMPNSVQYAGNSLFKDCKTLKRVTLSKNLISVIADDSIFAQCTSIEHVSVPAGGSRFASEDGVLYDKAKTIIYYFPPAKDPAGLKLPDTLVTIERGAFSYFQGASLELPESLETIGDKAFQYCKLTSLHIPRNVKSIGDEVFYFKDGECFLESVTFAPDSKLESIGQYGFGYTIKLKSISLPDNVSSIGTYAFMNCSSLEEVVLPAALEDLQANIFYSCPNIKKFVMQEGLKTIADSALAGSTSKPGQLKEIVIPSTVISIGNKAFQYQTGLQTVTFAEGSQLETLGTYVFGDCSSLEGITLPAKLKTLQTSSANYSVGGVSVTFHYSYAFQNCASLKYVDMSACTELTELPPRVLDGCANVERLLLPAKLVTIHDCAFGDPLGKTGKTLTSQLINLKEITIPASITFIGGYVFYGCEKLESITFEDGRAGRGAG